MSHLPDSFIRNSRDCSDVLNNRKQSGRLTWKHRCPASRGRILIITKFSYSFQYQFYTDISPQALKKYCHTKEIMLFNQLLLILSSHPDFSSFLLRHANMPFLVVVQSEFSAYPCSFPELKQPMLSNAHSSCS